MHAIIRAITLVIVLATPFAAAAWTFPDAHDDVPSGWTGPVFRLSQDYPASDSSKAVPPSSYPWLQIDFRGQPATYLKAVFDYVLEGNREVDWVVQKNAVRSWYHAPWMHYGPKGREFVRGLTHERSTPRPSQPGKGELGPLQTSCFQNWAVGFLNEPGGFVIGQVWGDPFAPDPVKALFPEGTVAAKLLFTAATVDQAPYLAGTLEWQANVEDYSASELNCRNARGRKIQTMRLLQIDLAMRDNRANATTRWVFATFTYDGNRQGAEWSDRMVPVGLMWGNDPTLTQAAFDSGQRVQESWINPDLGTPQHLGWLGRLNGPVDNPASACLSCHATAQVPTHSPMMPPSDASDRMRWFANLPAGNSFDQRAISTDYNLQLSAGILNFQEWKEKQEGFFAPAPMAAGPKVLDVDEAGREKLMINKQPVHRVTRQ